jgi:hypothetical protein
MGWTPPGASFAEGQTSRPFSRRFMNIQAPWRVPPDDLHEVTTAATEDKEMTAKRVLLQHGLCLRRERRNSLRMSVTSAASQTRVLAGNGITPSAPGSTAPAPRDHTRR